MDALTDISVNNSNMNNENTTNSIKKRKSNEKNIDNQNNNDENVAPNIVSSSSSKTSSSTTTAAVIVKSDNGPSTKRLRSQNNSTSNNNNNNNNNNNDGNSKPRSALPRFQSNKPSIKAPTSSSSSSTAAIITTTAAATIAIDDKRRIATEQNTHERRPTTTPSKKDLQSILSATPSSVRRMRGNMKVQTFNTDKITQCFENAFSVNDEKVNTILQSLKVKSKWDIKEKSKKQESVIKDLKDSLISMLNDSKKLKDNCLAQEHQINISFNDLQSELRRTHDDLALLRENEIRFKKEILKKTEEVSKLSDSLDQVKREKSPIRSRAENSERKLNELYEKFNAEKSSHIDTQATCAELERQVAQLKKESVYSSQSVKDQNDQMKEEVSTLKNELDKKQSNLDRYANEKINLDKTISDLKEELIKCQSSLRESETSTRSYERDSDRQKMELDMLRAQLNQKDLDMRSTLASLQESQTRMAEDKSELRAELTICKSRLQSLEEERLVTAAQIATKNEELQSSSREVMQLRESVSLLESKLASKDVELFQAKEAGMQLEIERELRSRCEVREEAERRERIAACAQLLATQTESYKKLQDLEEKSAETVSSLKGEIAAISSQRDESNEEIRRQGDIIMGLQSEIQQARLALENASTNHETVEKVGRLTGEIEILRRRMKETSELKDFEGTALQQKILDLEDKLKAGELQRRKLHNLVQELRGNVRVFARVRPFLPNDGVDFQNPPEPSISTRSDNVSLRIFKPAHEDVRAEDHSFSFDKVFGPSSSQESIFQEVSEFVQSALDGYNVCLFSYGQTGSGKTHTMQGSGNGSMRGLIPRAMQQVGQYKNELESKGWHYEMEVSFIEIYNETIKDLLRNNATDDLKHEIKKDANGTMFVSDIEMLSVDPNDTIKMDSIMEMAAHHRSVGQTAMNERSSRSHSIFTLHLKASNLQQGISLNGTLSLVDLAGSERLDRSGVTGNRMKESVAINKSLSALTDVFVAIANKQSHIPFRNSKLTYLLQPALSGDGKTLMMVNLSPTEDSFYESLCSLRFANQVNQCELGKPKRQLKEDSSSSSSSMKNNASSTIPKKVPDQKKQKKDH